MSSSKAKASDNGQGTDEDPRVWNKIVIGEGKPYEKTIRIPEPKGRAARKKIIPLIAFVGGISELDSTASMITTAFQDPKFEDEYLPMALNMDDEEGRAWLEENGTLMEILQAFMDAVQIIMSFTGDRPEVQEAIKKSEGDGVAPKQIA